MTLSIHTDRALIRADAKSTRFILARVTAPRAEARAARLPVNVAIVLDRSGSMGGAHKFPLAREAVRQSLRMLGSADRFSLIVYDTVEGVLTPSTSATPNAVRAALGALDAVGPRNSTNLSGGWLKSCNPGR